MFMAIRLALLFATVLLSSAALAAETKSMPPSRLKEESACTWFSSIDDWQRLDDRNLIVWVSRKQAYHIQLSMPLFGLRSTISIAFIDHDRDGRLCGYAMDQVVVPHAPIYESSTILAMTQLDEAGLQQLAEKYKVKLDKRPKSPSVNAEPAEQDSPPEPPRD
jgi:hypothetical protein